MSSSSDFIVNAVGAQSTFTQKAQVQENKTPASAKGRDKPQPDEEYVEDSSSDDEMDDTTSDETDDATSDTGSQGKAVMFTTHDEGSAETIVLRNDTAWAKGKDKAWLNEEYVENSSSDDEMDDTTSDETDDATSDTGCKGEAAASVGISSKKRQVTGVAEPPTAWYLTYSTEKYPIYDAKKKNVGTPVTHSHVKFSDYDGYSLFINHTITSVDQIPKAGVRLDDLTVAFLSQKLSGRALNSYWQSEFDQNGMVRGLRVPLGHAAKEYKRAGDRDLDGNVLTEQDEGWYYMWYRGLHLLFGKEGLDAQIYLKRPAFETIRCHGLGWKKSYPAVIQHAPGYVGNTSTPGSSTGTVLADIETTSSPTNKAVIPNFLDETDAAESAGRSDATEHSNPPAPASHMNKEDSASGISMWWWPSYGQWPQYIRTALRSLARSLFLG